jgi:hypothetical protein
MPMLRRPSLSLLAVLGLGLTAGACADDPPPPKLFQEDGTWSVVRYDLTGGGQLREVDVMTRRDAFMLHFDASAKVVTTAACIESPADNVSNSLCLINPQDTRWDCRCFAYDFVREEQLWQEFNAGDLPPKVSLSSSDDAAAGDSEGGGGGGDNETYVTVGEVPDVSSTYSFRPLPDGVFGSNGMSSRFIVQKKANSLFDRVFDDPDGRATCTPCI